MRATGIIRRVDDLGRIVIPKEIRETLRIEDGEPMELFIEDDGVFFRKYSVKDCMDVVEKDVIEQAMYFINEDESLTTGVKSIAIKKLKEILKMIVYSRSDSE